MKIQKKCTKCKVIKNINDYSRDVRASDNRTSQCKKCFQEYKKNRRKKEEIIAFDYYE